jgi:hypothetical protein
MELSPGISSAYAKRTPDTDLEKSVRLLDDAFTGKSLLRVNRSTPQRRVTGTPRRG